MRRLTRVLIFAMMLCGMNSAARGADQPRSDEQQFAGQWIFATADINSQSDLSLVWHSTLTLTLTPDSFRLTKFWGLDKPTAGKFSIDPTANPKRIDISVERIDLSASVNYPACTLPGIYKFDGNRLIVSFGSGPGARRPSAFHPDDRDTATLTLVRADDFKDFPKQIRVSVKDSAGREAAGVSVFTFMNRWQDINHPDVAPQWQYLELAKTDANGIATVKYDDLIENPLAAGDPEHGTMGLSDISPATLKDGSVSVELRQPCKISGTLICDEIAAAGKTMPWTNVYLSKSGRRLSSCSSFVGKYEFLVPPGEYQLYAYGQDLNRKTVEINVPAAQAEFQPPPIHLSASRFQQLVGKSAPELRGVVAWKGQPIKLADLRGKIVLLDFWGYWCGPCVQAMPTLFRLHKKFADKGLAIVTVHVDLAGEIDTPEKLDQKIAVLKKDQWKGEDFPFSAALACGRFVTNPDGSQTRSGPSIDYGILSYPTTVLIDRNGNIVGTFEARDAEEASAEIEKLLKPPEPNPS
jgi:uncharacterized protein (TIGR03067 family)